MRAKLYPHADKWACGLFAAITCVAVLLASGCAVGPKAEALIEAECRAVDTTLAKWGAFTPATRKEDVEDTRAGLYEIRYAVLGVPLPPDLEARHEADKALEGIR